jgi:hypothetical protein
MTLLAIANEYLRSLLQPAVKCQAAEVKLRPQSVVR